MFDVDFLFHTLPPILLTAGSCTTRLYFHLFQASLSPLPGGFPYRKRMQKYGLLTFAPNFHETFFEDFFSLIRKTLTDSTINNELFSRTVAGV